MASYQSFFKNRVLLHVLGWIVFFLAPLLLSPPHELARGLADTRYLESLVLRNGILMLLFYTNLIYITPKILKERGVGRFLLILIPIILIVSFVNWRIHHELAESMGFQRMPPLHREPGGPRPPFFMASSLFASLLITAIVASISTSVVLWNDWVTARRAEQERAFQKVASELAVLKLQISPHFLFNTLNNIRWLVRSKSDQAEVAVVRLSQLLRYILYQSEQEKISLAREIDNLRDYISLQQMRLTEHQNLIFNVSGEAGDLQIVPLLFMPMIENVFKYGDFTGASPTTIQLTIKKDHLLFRTENRIVKTKPDADSGIGLNNVRKRLQLHYPGKHHLACRETDGNYILELSIILS